MNMALIKEYDLNMVLSHHFHNPHSSVLTMKKAIRIYWPNRGNAIARSRINSAISIIRLIKLRSDYVE